MSLFLCLQNFFLQKTGVFDEPEDWSQYQCVLRKYFNKNTIHESKV
jgi:hypothetical protein